MRQFTTSVQGELNKRFGTEPLMVVEIDWVGNQSVAYSDSKINGEDYPYPFIVQLGNFNTSSTVSGSGQSQSLSIVLSDIDGSLKNIVNTVDVHKRPVRVYLLFAGLPVTEKVLLYQGVINSPMVWDEGSRTFTFDVFSELEGREVGFAMEDGDFPYVPPRDRNKNWPLVFGDVCHMPGIQVTALRKGYLATGQGVMDPTLDERLCQAQKLKCAKRQVAPTALSPTAGSNNPAQGGGTTLPGPNGTGAEPTAPSNPLLPVREITTGNPATTTNPATNVRVGQEDQACLTRRLNEICGILHDQEQQQQYVRTELTIRGGDQFPQNQKIKIKIDDVAFEGVMQGENFTIQYVYHPDDERIQNPVCKDIREAGVGYRLRANSRIPTKIQDCTSGSTSNKANITGGAGESWEYYQTFEKGKFIWLAPGSDVFLDGESTVIYIASLLPGVVTQVAAYRRFEDTALLMEVPTDYYTVETVDYGGYEVVEVHLKKALSLYDDEDWDDDIYISFSGTVGPNPVDVIQWIVQTYTDLEVDPVTFAAVRNDLLNYPTNFYITERKQAFELIQDIAYQSRCAAVVRNNILSLVYLSKEPTSVVTITEKDIVNNSFQFSHTTTEDLVTRHNIQWKESDAGIFDDDETELSFMLKYNIPAYGVFEQDFDYYTQNTFSTVLKSATFWMIRKAQTWRYVEFETPLHLLGLELFDCFTLNIAQFPPNTKCVVTQADYNADSNTIRFRAWTPILSGTDTPYYWAWPALKPGNAVFPMIGDESKTGGGYLATVRPPIDHPLYGGYNEEGQYVWTAGDRHPSDLDDEFPYVECQTATGAELSDQLEPALEPFEPLADAQFNDRQDDIAAGGSGGDENKEEKEACGGPTVGGGCTYEVIVTYITPTIVPCDGVHSSCISSSCGGGPCGCGSVTLSTGKIREFHGSHPCSGPSSSMCHTFGASWAASSFRNSKKAEIEALKANCGYYCGTGYPYSVSGVKSIPGEGIDGACSPTTEYGGGGEVTKPKIDS